MRGIARNHHRTLTSDGLGKMVGPVEANTPLLLHRTMALVTVLGEQRAHLALEEVGFLTAHPLRNQEEAKAGQADLHARAYTHAGSPDGCRRWPHECMRRSPRFHSTPEKVCRSPRNVTDQRGFPAPTAARCRRPPPAPRAAGYDRASPARVTHRRKFR